MAKENVSFDFRLKKIDETRNYLSDETKYNDLLTEKGFKNFLAFYCFYFCCQWLCFNFFFCTFYSLFGVPVSIASSAIQLKIFVITPDIENYISILKKKKNSMIK